jgi:hypothetical protein
MTTTRTTRWGRRPTASLETVRTISAMKSPDTVSLAEINLQKFTSLGWICMALRRQTTLWRFCVASSPGIVAFRFSPPSHICSWVFLSFRELYHRLLCAGSAPPSTEALASRTGHNPVAPCAAIVEVWRWANWAWDGPRGRPTTQLLWARHLLSSSWIEGLPVAALLCFGLFEI